MWFYHTRPLLFPFLTDLCQTKLPTKQYPVIGLNWSISMLTEMTPPRKRSLLIDCIMHIYIYLLKIKIKNMLR